MRSLRTAFCLAVSLCISYTSVACDLGLDQGLADRMNLSSANTELSKYLYNTALEHEAMAKPVDKLVEDIDCYLQAQEKQLAAIADIRSSLTRAGRSLYSAQGEFQRSMALEGLNANVNRDAGTGFVVFPNSSAGKTEVSLYQDLLEVNCSAEASQSCANSLQLAKHLWWIAGQYRGFADNYNQSAKQESLAFNQALDTQWRSYKNDTIKLWPHEVALNSLFYKPAERGLSAPPSYKLMTLRPSLGLSYLSDQSHHIQPTVNIDLLGVYWWEYSNGSAHPGRGLSLSAIWDGGDTAYGVSYHHNPRWSFSVAEGEENDLVISMSFQLAYWFLQR